MPTTTTILSPVPDGTIEAADALSEWTLPERIRLGLLSNGKPNTSHLLEGLLEVLEADPRIAPAQSLRKESASRPAAADVLEALRGGVDLVIVATAD